MCSIAFLRDFTLKNTIDSSFLSGRQQNDHKNGTNMSVSRRTLFMRCNKNACVITYRREWLQQSQKSWLEYKHSEWTGLWIRRTCQKSWPRHLRRSQRIEETRWQRWRWPAREGPEKKAPLCQRFKVSLVEGWGKRRGGKKRDHHKINLIVLLFATRP